jgi:hypothetical protein
MVGLSERLIKIKNAKFSKHYCINSQASISLKYFSTTTKTNINTNTNTNTNYKFSTSSFYIENLRDKNNRYFSSLNNLKSEHNCESKLTYDENNLRENSQILNDFLIDKKLNPVFSYEDLHLDITNA